MATSRDPGSDPGSSMIPTLTYRDPEAAIAWLRRAFGFTQRLLVRDDAGAVRHAQLTWGAGMVMLSRADAEPAAQGVCVVVGDVDAHHARAVAAGAVVELPPSDQGHGRMYSCRDPEGHRWHFGEYDPWAPPAA